MSSYESYTEAQNNDGSLSISPDAYDEVIAIRPGFLVRRGLIVLLIVLFGLLLLSYFVRFPDVIEVNGKLMSVNAPKPVVTVSGGKLTRLFVREGAIVDSGSVIGFVEATGSHEEVLRLLQRLDTAEALFNNSDFGSINQLFARPLPNSLGELQTAYQEFKLSVLSFEGYIKSGFFIQKKTMLYDDLLRLHKMNQSLNERKALVSADLGIFQKTFDANLELRNEKVISEFDYRNEQSKLIAKKMTLPQITESIIANEEQINGKNLEILELNNSIHQQKAVFGQALGTFKSRVVEWCRKYVLFAPVSGTVTYNSFLQENLQVQQNQTVCFVNPMNTEYFASITIPQKNFGKVAVSQPVLLKFDSYPFEEYGIVRGQVEYISQIPSDSGYIAKVKLPLGLETSYSLRISYREGLSASGSIVTKDSRLIERFYFMIIRSLKKNG